MSDGKLPPLVEFVGEVWSLVRSTDTFRSLTAGAADGIEKRAEHTESLAGTLRSPMGQPGLSQRFEEIAQRLDRQAAAEKRVADRLRELRGED